LAFIDWKGLGEDFSGFDEGLLELCDGVEDTVLKGVPEEVLSLHSDALGESLEIVDEVNSVAGLFQFSDAGFKNLFFPGLEAL
jgi:hypothetical protein